MIIKTITIDTNIIIDFVNPKRNFHKSAQKLFSKNKYKLFLCEVSYREIIDADQKVILDKLIEKDRINILPEPVAGVSLPLQLPFHLPLISVHRDKIYYDYLRQRKLSHKKNYLYDFLIAEAHKRSNNDILLTLNKRDFLLNHDIIIRDYLDLKLYDE